MLPRMAVDREEVMFLPERSFVFSKVRSLVYLRYQVTILRTFENSCLYKPNK
jgi:hypothetical protein